DLGFLVNRKGCGSEMLIDRGELRARRRSFRPVLPSRNSHRSDATHVPLADGGGGSACSRPFRLCSSPPAEFLSPTSIRCAACTCGYPDDPGPWQACMPETSAKGVERTLLESFS